MAEPKPPVEARVKALGDGLTARSRRWLVKAAPNLKMLAKNSSEHINRHVTALTETHARMPRKPKRSIAGVATSLQSKMHAGG